MPQGDLGPLDLSRIAQDLQIRKVQVESVVQLLDEGNTIPFITRYRKERTGGLDEEVLRTIQERVGQLRQLADRKRTILKSIEGQGKLTPALRDAIIAADNPKRLEDLYLPYKPKKRTLASTAREKGLEPLAMAIWYQDPAAANLTELLPTLVNPEKDLKAPEDVLLGVQHILAETIAEAADVRAIVRIVLWDTGRLCTSKSEKLAEGQGLDYKDYFQFTEPIRHIPPHRVLAINRGEKENVLTVKLEWEAETGLRAALDRLPLPPPGTPLPLPAAPPAPPAEAPAPPPAAAVAQPPAKTTAAPEIVPPPATDAPLAPVAEAGPPPAPEATAPVADGLPPALAVADAAPASGEDQPPAPPVAEAAPTPVAEAKPPAAPAAPPAAKAPAAAALIPPPTPTAPRSHYHHGIPPKNDYLTKHAHAEFLKKVAEDALNRLLVPSLEREIRRELTGRAEDHAVTVFARNLRSKLLAAPLRGKRVLAIDPGFRTGCKLAVLDETGNLVEDGVVFPHTGSNKRVEAKSKLEELARKHQVHVVAIGNGTACRETEEVVSEVIGELDLKRRGLPIPPPAPAPIASPAPPPPAPPVAESAGPAPTSTAPQATTEPAPPLMETAPPSAPAEAPAPPVPDTSQPLAILQTPAAELQERVQQELNAPQVQEAAAAVAEGAPPQAAAQAEAAKPQTAVEAPAPAAPAAPPLPDALPELAYVIVNEAGASVYSASPVGREEFPNFDATLRGTISIGRRLQDPLSELVKIDPQHVGVGLYQHDVNPRHLRESLDAVIESCVNTVGVDLNTASVPLLRHVSGLNQLVARDLVEYRKNNGPFQTRDQLLQVPGIGEARFVQSAGFLKIIGGVNPLDRTWIHPESYPLARQLLNDLGYGPEALEEKEKVTELHDKLKAISPEEVANRLQVGVPTVRDVLAALARPGRDPREDLPPPIFKKGILKLEDLQPGMELKGTVLNVVDFGAFIDIGLKDSGLVHISQMANRYVKSPYDVAAVGDVVTVWVLSVDKDRRRVSLTMIAPGTERKPPEKKVAPPRREGPPAGRPPQGQRQGPPQGGRRPPPRGGQGGRPGGRPLQRGGQPAQVARPVEAAAQAATPAASPQAAAPPPPPPPPPRKPKRQPPKPKLSQAALAGKESLGTFAELAAFWEAKKTDDTAAAEAPPPQAEPVPAPVPAPEAEQPAPPPA
jgi:uncharacterized protein